MAKASGGDLEGKLSKRLTPDNNFTKGKMERRLAQIEESVARYLSQLDTADRSDRARVRSDQIPDSMQQK